ncbi:uncharacterized protein [Triticum aestivum]|uniref:uncharacterized protein isoform X2 n=1 Tax=Triticum aestivum TaxID=4565 RepID=UPI001D010D41|nr:uncharacterized protein LOC123121785 isoform X2 [Triticum aestivum]XP_044397773.1 uncharacterized protein LOC123121785 isoform X2 [Triticum aestivum]
MLANRDVEKETLHPRANPAAASPRASLRSRLPRILRASPCATHLRLLSHLLPAAAGHRTLAIDDSCGRQRVPVSDREAATSPGLLPEVPDLERRGQPPLHTQRGDGVDRVAVMSELEAEMAELGLERSRDDGFKGWSAHGMEVLRLEAGEDALRASWRWRRGWEEAWSCSASVLSTCKVVCSTTHRRFCQYASHSF